MNICSSMSAEVKQYKTKNKTKQKHGVGRFNDWFHHAAETGLFLEWLDLQLCQRRAALKELLGNVMCHLAGTA